MFTKKQVQDMAEKDLRKQVLIPLLQAMKFQSVHEYHGTTEFGKDIVCWDTDKLNNRENLALVVKATAVSGQSAASADIENQVRQCFSKPYIDPITGAEESVHHCWVVSNKPISSNAVDLIKAGIGHAVYAKNVKFIGIDKLWELIEKHMPLQVTLQKLVDVQQDFETWDTHYRLEALVDGTGVHHTLAEKFPGAAQEKPLTFHLAFEIPNTEDGREHVEALERFRETGTPVKIPGTYIKNLEYPDILQQVYPAMTNDGFLQFGPIPHPKPLLLRGEIVCDDGDRFVLDYIHLTCTQAGQKEATLTNDTQPIPFKVQMVIHVAGGVCGIHMSMDHNAFFNVHQQLRQLQLMCCVSKPHTMRFTNLETGMVVASSRNEVGACAAPDEEAFEVLGALNALQIKSGKLVYFPDRDSTEEEYQVINMLREVFRTGKQYIPWFKASASAHVTDENRDDAVQRLSQLAEAGTFAHFEGDETLSLFGEIYTLGPVKPLSVPIKLANWPETKVLLDEGFCGTVKLEFVPRDEGSFTKEYVNWLPDCNDVCAPTDSADFSQ